LVTAAWECCVHSDREPPGYFLARRQLSAVGMFGVLAALTVTALAITLT
jgi:hypothetical protein